MAKATFAAGCFWGVESVFQQVPGVLSTQVGYTGGHTERPTYEAVCRHTTGHAEAVQIEFDPNQISYSGLLDVLWANHDPTTLNRQGPDTGDQYRSAIFTENEEQKAEAVASRERAQARFQRPIVTEITPAPRFWPAEEYHQKYFEKRGIAAACHI
jgi:peptide-methionine (S)-S-oxide reductase